MYLLLVDSSCFACRFEFNPT